MSAHVKFYGARTHYMCDSRTVIRVGMNEGVVCLSAPTTQRRRRRTVGLVKYEIKYLLVGIDCLCSLVAGRTRVE